MKTSTFIIAVLFLFSCNKKETLILKKGQVIACIGDSVTSAGNNGYVEYLQNYVNTNHSDLNLTFLNWGLSGETITGLTESYHYKALSGPRAYLFDRLEGLLKTATKKPDVAILSYGVNCGIYGPPSKELFDKYKKGLLQFLNKMEAQNSKVILMTPPPFAIEAGKANGWIATSNEKYSWENPYPNYDEEVIQKFRDIVLNISHPSIIKKIDIHTPLKAKQMQCYGKDPIHPKAEGYELIGNTLLENLSL